MTLTPSQTTLWPPNHKFARFELGVDIPFVTHLGFDLMLFELEAADIPLKPNRDQAWADFQGWRVNYDSALVAIAHMVIAPEGRWSTDRPGDRLVPRMRGGTRTAKRPSRKNV